jgi:lipopolysaccharide/colanic/teichoic acid biosynthesis glycosyltransferase
MDRFANSLMGGVIAVAVISIVLTVLIIMYRRDKSIYVKIETLKEKKEKTIETKQEDDWCIRIIDVILSLIALIVLFPIFFTTTIVIKILSGESVLEKTAIVGKHKKSLNFIDSGRHLRKKIYH